MERLDPKTRTTQSKNPGNDAIPEASSSTQPHNSVEQIFLHRLNQLRSPEVERFLGRVSKVPLLLPNLPNKFVFSDEQNAMFSKMFNPSAGSRTDWTDANMMNRPGVVLDRLEDNKVVELGRAVLKALTSCASQQSVAGILVLAWNLRSPTTFLPMFPKVDPTATGEDVPISQISDHGESNSTYTSGEITELTYDVAVNAAGYAYFAASLLRLATKPAENYLAALPGIKGTFRNFYNTPFPLQNLVGNKKMIEYVRLMLTVNRLRNSLTGFLYVHKEILDGKGLRKYLYEQHLGYTGMHAYDLALKILKEERFTLRTICTSINSRFTEAALKELFTILGKSSENGGADESALETWRYARVFDQQYFKAVQTKNCPELVYILATIWYATNAQDDPNAGDIFKIKQIQNISDLMKYQYTSVAFKAYSDPENTSNQNYWKFE